MMTSAGQQALLSNLDARELEAQRLACMYLVKGCERALFHFGLVAGEQESVEATRVDKRAVDIMRSVLSSWRDTLSLLPAPSTSQASPSGWMVMRTPPQQDNMLKRRAD